jgi:hypothetical protein
MNVPDRAFERALGMSPATLAEYAEAALITETGVKSVVMTDRIIGCPMKKASTTRVPTVQLVRSGQDATAGPASACTRD